MNERQIRARRRARLIAVGALLLVVVAAGAIALATIGSPHRSAPPVARARKPAVSRLAKRTHRGASRTSLPHSTVHGVATGKPGSATVPVLMYHVINPPPAGAPFPGLYVPSSEFAAQMRALKAAGWHAITMDQLEAYWSRGVPLGPGKPIVITFDNGYASQYVNAMPILKQLGWVGDENIQLTGLPPSQGGLTNGDVRGLLAAGWELDTQGMSHADLIALDAAQLHYQVDTARAILRKRYDVPVDWFCYPSGHYDPTVIAAIKAAGFVGSTTVIPGWANRTEDPYRLPRLRVLDGTSPAALLHQIATAQADGSPPGSYGGAGTA